MGVAIERFPPPGTSSWQLKQVLERYSVDLVIDVGAHEGEFARKIRSEAGYRGRVISFEPHADSYEALSKRMKSDSLWTGQQLALGDAPGTMRLLTFEGSAMNSVFTPNAFGMSTFGSMRPTGSEEVPVQRLDSLVLRGEALLLKTDTQGYDLRVLEGATGILDRVVAIIIELSVKPIYDGTPFWIDTVLRLRTLGFGPAGLFPISRDPHDLQVIEFDGIFVRDNRK